MIEPWQRSRLRLGLKLEANAIGFALLRLGPDPASIRDEGEESGDSRALAISRARAAVAAGAQGVDLHGYLDDAAFALSRAAAEGMTREEHCLLIARIASELRADGVDVRIEWLDRDGYVLPGLAPDDPHSAIGEGSHDSR